MVSLAELVDRAGDGDTVAIPPILTPGTGTVVINRSLHLVCTSGAEVSDDIVVGGAATLLMSGITGTGVLAASAGAQLVARDCRFNSQGPAVVATGAGSRLELNACRFTGGDSNAVRLRGGASARVVNCDFAFLESPAVVVEGSGSSVEVTGCRFASMTGHAVLVEGGGVGRVADCSFDHFVSARWTAVIAVSSGSSVEVTDCRFASMTAHGVFVRGGGLARVADSNFFDCSASAAVTAQDPDSSVEVTGCRFTNITGRGVAVSDGGLARVADCRFEAVGDLAAVLAEGEGSRIDLAGCRIASVKSVGMAASAGAELDVRDSSFDCPGGGGLAEGNIRLGRDGSRLRLAGSCRFRGATVRVAGGLGYREAATGAVVKIATAFRAPCTQCNGSGGRPGASLTACSRCEGRGEGPPHSSTGNAPAVPPLSGSLHYPAAVCAACRGSGLITDDPCTDCGGDGGKPLNRAIEIAIPVGVRTGHTLIAAGQGAAGLGGGPSGDLHIVLSVLDPPFRTVEDFFEKTLGVHVAGEGVGRTSNAERREPDDAARRELDEAVRREAIRLGYLPSGDADDPPAPQQRSELDDR